MKSSVLEDKFMLAWRVLDGPEYEREYRFVEDRKWRFDFAWPVIKVAVEVEGGLHIRGRHQRPAGYKGDIEKYNRAAAEGWRVLRVTTGFGLDDVEAIVEFVRGRLDVTPSPS